MAYTRLTAQDAAFLHIETPTAPMHVGSLGIFEAGPFQDEQGRFRLEDARRLVESRLDHVPRFRQKLMHVPLSQGRPVWVDDEHFDLNFHVRLTALPRPGDEHQLKALMSRLQAQPLDRNRPLWELWFVEGLEGDRVAIIQKTHHALVDGISGVDVAVVLLDLEPQEPPSPGEIAPWEPAPAPTPAQLLAETLLERTTQPAELVRTLRAAVRGPRQLVGQARDVGKAVAAIGSIDAPRMPFNQPIGPHRRFEMARASLDAVKEVREAFGCTVNDVVLASVAGGLRHFLTEADVRVEGLTLKALIPVSVRSDEEHLALGNRVAAMFAELPVGEPDPADRVRLLKEQLRDLKSSGQAVGVDRMVGLLEFAPPTLLSLAARLVPFQRSFNLVVTNVPGPQVPLYCMGARMLEAFPYVGIVDNMALVVGVVSYDGTLGFGLSSDRDLMPDLPVLAEGIEKSVAELVELARGGVT
jgi:diacylglycerol O-acyltransferase / wax synthase